MLVFYKRLRLSNKISFLVILSVVISLSVLGLYFDSFLQKTHLQETQKRMSHAFEQLSRNIHTVQDELKTSIAFVQTDESLLASIDLINNYQDKNDYNEALLDEEKKIITKRLLDKVKLSLNNDIALYDKNDEIIAFVVKKPQGYYQNFISYEKSETVLYSKYEDEKVYSKRDYIDMPLLKNKHIANYTDQDVNNRSYIEYRLINDDVIIKSHRNILSLNNAEIVAHIEMSYIFDQTYFSTLSEQLNVDMTTSRDIDYTMRSSPLNTTSNFDSMIIHQTEQDYSAALNINTLDGDIFIVTTLNKANHTKALNENRKQFFIILFLVLVIIFVMLDLLFSRGLADPLGLLMHQIMKIEQRDYSRSRQLTTGDELEAISKNLNDLAQTIQLRETSLKKSQENLEYLSNHDPLTDLPNRRFFNVLLQHALNIAKRNKKQLALLFLDLDDFKHINDTLGHDIGDELLQQVAIRLSDNLRSTDTLARIGGDEFNLLIENATTISEVHKIVQKILEDFIHTFTCSGHEIKTTVSIGIAMYPNDGLDTITLIKNSDLALYKAKDEGRNRFSFFSNELSEDLENRMLHINALKTAIDSSEEFYLVYQPKISVLTGKIIAVEALIRWNSKEFGVVMPSEFIPLAEETRLIVPLGEWVLMKACSDFVKLRSLGYHLEHISINVSTIQLDYSDLIASLQKTILDTGIDPHQIELEITESYIASNEKRSLQILRSIRDLEIQLAIDDFGTGYSSLSYLQKLPVTRLKIDKSFVDDLPYSLESVAVANAIIALAKTFDLFITAEGVETHEQLTFLQNMHCDEIQGYFYSKPLDLEALKAYMALK